MNTEVVCAQIKLALKTKSITQDDFAIMLGISVPTIKRWLRGEGLLFRDLTKMLELLDLRLSEVSLIAEGNLNTQFNYSVTQEEALANTEGLLAFFDQLLKGRTPKQIAKSYKLSEKSLTFYLSKLDKIKLIQWLPQDKVKLLVSGEPSWIQNGLLSQKFKKQIIEEHLRHHLNSKDQMKVGIYSLSKASYQKINIKMNEVIEQLRIMEIKDANISDSKELTTIIMGHAQHEIPILTKIPQR